MRIILNQPDDARVIPEDQAVLHGPGGQHVMMHADKSGAGSIFFYFALKPLQLLFFKEPSAGIEADEMVSVEVKAVIWAGAINNLEYERLRRFVVWCGKVVRPGNDDI